MRACDAVRALGTSARGTTITPSSSATTTSPGCTVWPPSTTGTFTAPAVALTEPCALTARDQAGKPISCSSATSRTPLPSTTPRTPRWASAVANISSNSPSVDGEFVARSEEHTSELQSRQYLVCRLLLEKKKKI